MPLDDTQGGGWGGDGPPPHPVWKLISDAVGEAKKSIFFSDMAKILATPSIGVLFIWIDGTPSDHRGFVWSNDLSFEETPPAIVRPYLDRVINAQRLAGLFASDEALVAAKDSLEQGLALRIDVSGTSVIFVLAAEPESEKRLTIFTFAICFALGVSADELERQAPGSGAHLIELGLSGTDTDIFEEPRKFKI
jgi:hypothetical protein